MQNSASNSDKTSGFEQYEIQNYKNGQQNYTDN